MTDPKDAKPVRLLKPSETARFLAVSQRTLSRLTARGELPDIRIGGSQRFDMNDILAYVSKQRSRRSD